MGVVVARRDGPAAAQVAPHADGGRLPGHRLSAAAFTLSAAAASAAASAISATTDAFLTIASSSR